VVLAWATNVATTSEIEYQALEVDLSRRNQLNTLGLLTKTTGGEAVNLDVLQKLNQSQLASLPVIPKGAIKTVYAGKYLTRHLEYISGLSDGSLYVFTLKGRDEHGNQVVGESLRYVTGADTRAPIIKNVIIETPLSGVGSEAKGQIIVSWETDEPSLGQILWDQGTGSEYAQSTEREESLRLRHVIVIRDLAPTTSYHLKIVSQDKSGNTTESKDTVVVTPASQQAAFDVIIKNLEDVFGFLKF